MEIHDIGLFRSYISSLSLYVISLNQLFTVEKKNVTRTEMYVCVCCAALHYFGWALSVCICKCRGGPFAQGKKNGIVITVSCEEKDTFLKLPFKLGIYAY